MTEPTPPRLLANARSLRREMTGPERVFWHAVRGRRLAGLKIRRQVPLGPYVVDFLIPRHHLIIELDGASHDVTGEADLALESRGYRFLRFANDDVFRDLETVLHAVLKATGQDIPQ